MKTILPILFVFSLIVSGCEESASSFSYEKRITVASLIESNRAIDTVKLIYTAEVDKLYDPLNYAVTNALVRVIGVDVAFEDTLVYDVTNPGRYFSSKPAKIILPTKTYRLDVRTQDGKTVTAVTTVPDTFSLLFSTLKENSTIKYNTGLPVNFFSWSSSNFHGTYLPTITSLDSGAARILKSFIKDTTSGQPPEKVGYRVGLPREQTNTELPWIVLGYYGTTRFDVFAIDENYTNFLNQYVTSQGGELKEIRYNIQGGIGFFGSRTLAKGGITVYITP